MSGLWEYLDIYAAKPSLNIYGKKFYATTFGFVMSILSCFTMLTLSGYFINQSINRKDVSVIFNQDSKIYSQVNLTGFPLMVAIIDKNAQNIKDRDRIYNINIQYKRYEYATNNQTGKRSLIYKEAQIPLEGCDPQKHFGNWSSYFTDMEKLSEFFCMAPGNQTVTIDGVFGDNSRNFSILGVNFNKCVNNSATNKSDCFDQNKIDSTLSSVYVLMDYIDFDIDHNNINSPIVPIRKGSSTVVSSSVYKKINHYKKMVIYDTDYGYVFEDINSISSYQQDQVNVDVDLRTDPAGSFASVVLQNSSKVDKYKRTFMKFQTLAANIGGVIKGVMTAAQFLVVLFTRKLLNLSIINSSSNFNEHALNLTATQKSQTINNFLEESKIPVSLEHTK